jgi:RNA polymerase sigma-70 factor (ECF subfamily)
MVQAWTGIHRFNGEAKFSTWLYKVALFTILTAKRKDKKVKWVSMEGVESSTETEHVSIDQKEVLLLAIRQLSEVDKTLITMHLDGFSNTEIADFLGITVNNCQVKLHRVKEQVTKMIQNR